MYCGFYCIVFNVVHFRKLYKAALRGSMGRPVEWAMENVA